MDVFLDVLVLGGWLLLFVVLGLVVFAWWKKDSKKPKGPAGSS